MTPLPPAPAPDTLAAWWARHESWIARVRRSRERRGFVAADVDTAGRYVLGPLDVVRLGERGTESAR